MRFNVLFLYFLKKNLTNRWEITFSPLTSAILGTIFLTYGLRAFVGETSSAIMLLGWLSIQIIAVSVSMAVLATIEFSTTSVLFYKSLPIRESEIILASILSAALTTIPIPTLCLLIASLMGLKVDVSSFLLMVISLYIAATGVLGFILVFSSLVKNIVRLSIIASFLASILTYISPIYYPLNVFPLPVQVIMCLNPLTLHIKFTRQLVIFGELDYLCIIYLSSVSSFWFLLGYALLKRKMEKTG